MRFRVLPTVKELFERSYKPRALPLVAYDAQFAAFQREHDPRTVGLRKLRELRESLARAR